MQSASLSNTTLAQATADLDAIAKATDAICANLSADLSTVMGPGHAQGAQTATQVLKDIEQTFRVAKESKKGEKWLQKELSARIKTLVTAEREEAIKATAQGISKHLQSAATTNQSAAQTALKTCQDKLLALSQAQSQAQTLRSRARELAVAKYDTSVALIVAVSTQATTHDNTIKSISNQLITIYAGQDPTDPTVGKEITRLQTLRKSVEEEKAHLQRNIIDHFDESIGVTGSKKTQIDLVIPKAIEQGKGQTLIDNMRAYLRNRASEFYAILPEMHRISDDFDSTDGTYYRPPSKSTGLDTVNSAYKAAYLEQAETLYLRIKSLTPADIMNRVCSTFKYGMHEQFQTKCEDGDGPTAYFGLVSLFKPAKANHRDELIDHFNQAYLHFQKGDPKKKVENLRPKLVDAIQLGIQLNWSTTGKKIVQVLSRLDHVMGRKIDKYENGPDNPNDTCTYLQDLFATIETECDASARIGVDTKSDNKWHTQAHNVTATDLSSKECRYGAGCYRKNCSFKHPDPAGPIRSTHNQRMGKGGKGNGKGSRTQGKGKGNRDKGKHTCKARGCNQNAPADKLCTTCFKELLSKGGSITCKDGSEFQLKNPKQSMYGFSAQQIEGIKLMKQALSAEEVDYDGDSRPAPASIKRQRIQDRLGKANSSQAQADEARIQFLKAITHE